jgi:UDP-3-O-acyl-N-acetylglucosamine deacetylase
MSALAALEITDVEIEVDRPEIPSLDGCTTEFCSLLQSAGIAEIGERSLEGPFARIFVHSETEKIAISSGSGHWRYRFESTDRYPFDQEFETLDALSDYCAAIAPARTFGWESDLPKIQSLGLAKGLSLENALLLGDSGAVNTPKFPDEPARHKLLDAIGDIYLAGVPIRFLNFSGERSGHRLNVQAAMKLASSVART